MLIIREEQLKTIDEARELEYCREIVIVLERKCPELIANIDKSILTKLVCNSVKQGRLYGIKSRKAILSFVGLSIAAGKNFHSNNVIRKFFENERIVSPDVKVEWLFRRSLRILQFVQARNPLDKDLCGKG